MKSILDHPVPNADSTISDGEEQENEFKAYSSIRPNEHELQNPFEKKYKGLGVLNLELNMFNEPQKALSPSSSIKQLSKQASKKKMRVDLQALRIDTRNTKPEPTEATQQFHTLTEQN